MAPSRRSGNNDNNNNENPDIAAIIAHQLQTILPQIVTQVTNNVNNANNGNGGNGGGGNGNGRNNGCTFKAFQSCNPKEYDGKGGAIVLTRWIEKMENAAMAMTWNDFKALMVEEFCPNRFHELAKLVPHLVTPKSSRIKRYIAGLAPEIRGMLRATQPTTIQNAILRAGILTDEAVSCGTLTKGNDKRKVVEESGKSGGSWKDNKKAKVGTGFMATAPPRNEVANSNPNIVNPGYVIEVADGKKVEVDRIIRDCKLELGDVFPETCQGFLRHDKVEFRIRSGQLFARIVWAVAGSLQDKGFHTT
ncbi:hypothetical protein Tco_1248568 [Tanacetum coccineum]